MLSSVTLENWKSFGERQTVPLRPISVLVGPNNSGKSCFVSVGRFVRRLLEQRGHEAVKAEGGTVNLLHRPAVGDGHLRLEWTSERGSYGADLRCEPGGADSFVREDEWLEAPEQERISLLRNLEAILLHSNERARTTLEDFTPFGALREVALHNGPALDSWKAILTPLTQSRTIQLSRSALRLDSPFVAEPTLGEDGQNLASVLHLWRGGYPEKAEALDKILQKTLPEMGNALVLPAPDGKSLRLSYRHKDGERFDAAHVSDGVLLFTALAMHALDAGPGAVLFIEEPEESIHPRRIHEVFELFRRIVEEQGCQFVMTTHSPVLLNELRDEPEAILLFRRGPRGTLVTPLEDVPRLVSALEKSDPGEMLSNGFFNDPL